MALSVADDTRALTDEEMSFLRERKQGFEPIFRAWSAPSESE